MQFQEEGVEAVHCPQSLRRDGDSAELAVQSGLHLHDVAATASRGHGVVDGHSWLAEGGGLTGS